MSREFQQINVLIPGYSIEDLPTDLNEKSAASLLNAFAVAWHPRLLANSISIPDARQAESTELPTGQHIVLVPECSEDWLSHDWNEQLSDTLSAVFSSCSSREEYLAAIEERFPVDQPVDEDLVADFLALGTVHLQVSLLSRRMHHYVDPDQYLLENEAMSAADAALAGDVDKARDHLNRCFECLLDCREQFYPVEAFLVDICLTSEHDDTAELVDAITNSPALSLISTGRDFQQRFESSSEFADAVRKACSEGRLSLMIGHHDDLRLSLGSLAAAYSDVNRCRGWLRKTLPEVTPVWARRRFGMTASLPGLLSGFDFAGALHVVLDDGLYPDREHGTFAWEGPDGTSLPAASRIPLAIDGASGFLRFADRMTESMQDDSNAVVLFARLPKLSTPWLEDLRRAAKFGPLPAKFVTMSALLEETADSGTPFRYDDGEYLSPYLIQSSVLKTETPIASPAELHNRRGQLATCGVIKSLSAVLKPAAVDAEDLSDLANRINDEESLRLGPEPSPDIEVQNARLSEISTEIESILSASVAEFAKLVSVEAPGENGLLLLNSLPWKRTTLAEWPEGLKLPKPSSSVTDAWEQDGGVFVNCELPPGGFVWLSEASSGESVKPARQSGKPLAEPTLLRNQHFEVELSEITGGVASVRFHNQRANRVSQQIAFRYEQSKTVTIDDEEFTTPYAITRGLSSRVLKTGPATGAVETECEIIDVSDESVICRFRQVTTVERTTPRLTVDILLDEVIKPPVGNPWMTYLASRFAWDNESAAVSRSMLGRVSGFRMERFEAPDFVEVADADQRLLILPHGRPYLRRSGRRMLDSLLLVEGESARQFRFTLEFDRSMPMQAALEANCPPQVQRLEARKARNAESAWILGLSARNVAICQSRVAAPQPVAVASDDVAAERRIDVVMLLNECEGRSTTCRLHCARQPVAAVAQRFDGTVLEELRIVDGGVVIPFSGYQVREIRLSF